MADRDRDRGQPQRVQIHPQYRYEGGFKGQQRGGGGVGTGPSATKILAVLTALPVGGGLLVLSGMILAGTLIGLAVTTPLFVICSPVLVPATLLIAFAVAAFMASGTFGLTGLTSLSWVLKYARQASQAMPEQLDQAKRRMQDMAGFVGQKTKEVGQDIQRKAQHEGK